MHTALGRYRPIRILVAAFAAIALFATGARAALADQTVHVKHASLDNWQGQCIDSGGKITLWHFVITQIGTDAPSSITVYWGPGVSETVPLDKITGGTAQYDTSLHAGTLVTDATAIVPDAWTGQFNLSHVECQPGSDPPASVTTDVHLGATDGATPISVTNAAPAPLGSIVHDSAKLDTDPTGVVIPAGSNLGFSFWTTNDCSGEVQQVENVDVSGQATLVTIDPALVRGPLAAGGYSYRADFTSGDETQVSSAGGACEPFMVSKADTTTTTGVYDAAGNEVTNGSVALGTYVHDEATVGPQVGDFAITGTVTYSLFGTSDCTGVTVIADETVPVGTGSTALRVAPGSYGYLATYSGDDNYNGSTGVCEPFEVKKADTTTVTEVRNAAGTDITNQAVTVGTVVHDHATVGPQVSDYVITGTVTYRLYGTSDCTGSTLIPDETVAVGTDSTAWQVTTPGYYGYQATYSGDANYNGSTGVCEPFAVYQNGLTMGFWGNKNGVARITAAGGYGVNAVTIGRGAVIDTQAESLKVLPNTLNACGKGSPVIFAGQTATKDCTLAAGVNKNSLNTLAAQTLALGYNIKLVNNYAGQTIGLLQCGSYLPGTGLTATSTVQDAFNRAVALINGSAAGGTTTQSQIGAMNALLGCLNREA